LAQADTLRLAHHLDTSRPNFAHEFWAQNRLEGVSVFATLTMSFGPAMK